MGNVQRIFYYHVPTSMLSLLFPYVNFGASLCYLYWRSRDPLKALTADAVAIASAEVTVVYASICLLTGMLWGRAAWGIWWTWDARLTSMLLLWLLYVSYLMLRKLSATGQTHTLAAVFRSSPPSTCPSSICRSSGGAPSIPRRSFSAGRTRGIDPSMMPAFDMERDRLGDVGHLSADVSLCAGTPPPAN